MKLPIEVPNSQLPALLSKVAPIKIHAFSAFIWIVCRTQFSTRVRNHETIHYRQQAECLFVGQWILYGLFWLIGLCVYRSGRAAYYNNPFEREAYANDVDPHYLESRKLYSWAKYLTSGARDI